MESAVVSVAIVDDRRFERPSPLCRGRFSTGIELLAQTPAKARVGQFSDGVAQFSDAAEGRAGCFSTGIARPRERRLGSFADGIAGTSGR